MNKTEINELEIINTDEPAHAKLLQSPSLPIHFPLTKEDKNLIAAMKKKLHELGGVGLAAPQVNQAKQIIAVYIPEESAILRTNAKPYPMHILINPSYEGLESSATTIDFEACYSVTNKAGMVPRYNEIKVHFFDEEGICQSAIETGFYARVLQHEIDHINGTLIINRLSEDCVQGSMQEMIDLRRNQLSDEQKIIFDRLMKEKLDTARSKSNQK